MRTAPPARCLVAPFFTALVAACSFNSPPASPPAPCEDEFDALVYPILVRDCGFPDCHGDRERFFRVFGPGRTRLDPEATLMPNFDDGGVMEDPALAADQEASYQRARSMLAGAGRPEDSLLLRKPLEVDQGGAPHLGIDARGRDVFPSPDDERYQIMLEWARGVNAVGCYP